MKFLNYFKAAALMTAVTLSLTACGGDEDELDGPDGGEDVVTPTPDPDDDPTLNDLPAMSASEAKNYIEGVATEMLNLINPADQETLLRLIDSWSEKYDDYEAPANWNLDNFDESDKAPRCNPIKGFMKALRKAAGGDAAALSRATSELLDMARFSGVYEPGSGVDKYGDRVGMWVKKEDSKDIIFRFPYNGETVEVKGVGEGSTWSHTGYGATVVIPRIFTVTMKKGNGVLVSAKLDSNVDFSAHTINAVVEGSVANLNVKATVTGNNTVINADTYTWIGGTQISHTTAVVNGANMVDANTINTLFRQESDTYSDGYNEYVDTWYEFDKNVAGRMFRTGTLESVILGKVRIGCNVSSIGSIINESGKYFEQYQYGSQEEAKKACQEQCDIFNRVMPAEIYLQGSKNASGSVRYQPYLDVEDYGDGYSYWEWYSEPVLMFDDNAPVSFSEYFGRVSMPSVYNAAKSLIQIYRGYFPYLIDDDDDY